MSSSPDTPVPLRRRRRVAVLMAAPILGVLVIGLLLPAVEAMRETRRGNECGNRLRAVVVALQHYHDKHRTYPPAYVADAQGHRLHSWRVLILRELGYEALFARYRFDEPWDGPHNRRLIAEMPKEYGCPSDLSKPPGVTNYVAVVGCQTAWPAPFSVSIRNAHDGTSVTVQVVESCDLGAAWTEPRDLSYVEYRRGVNAREHPSLSSRHTHGAYVAAMDGNTQFLRDSTDWKSLHRFATINGGRPFPGAPCDGPVEYGDESSVTLRTADALQKTDVLPVLDTPIIATRNVVYCCTFQIVWDDLREQLGLPMLEIQGDPPLAASLNAGRFPRESLSGDAYVAVAGPTSDGVLGQFAAARQKKFPRASLPPPTPLAGSFLEAYCYLQKRLPFEHKFPKLDEPLRFQAADGVQPVTSWGLLTDRKLDAAAGAVNSQVRVLDYVDDQDFVLRLATRTDWIVLAKVTPKPTLAETWQAVDRRVRNPGVRGLRASLFPNEPFVVPHIVLFVERDFHELIGLPIVNARAGLPFGAAKQYIKFQLDESGARLESLAEGAAFALDDEDQNRPPERPRQFIFDRPFLLALQQQNAQVPYFILWVANAELLTPADTRPPPPQKPPT